MPRQKHYYYENHLHFLMRSTYRRARLFDPERLVERPGDWPWSSWHFYDLEDASLLPMDRFL